MALFYILLVVLTALLGVMAIRLHQAFGRFRIRKRYTAAIAAPSVSVCIPARNETHAMTQCLERVLASDYAKLEIVVFDDSSTDDTSILIRSFASAGVRFVPGTQLPEGWLGKNHALEVLAREASGTYIVFMDVDTYIQPTTISQLVGYTMTENMEMVSVIPGRNDSRRISVLFGHLRYFWELILSRATAPAASTALWMVSRRILLDTFGGFAPFKADVSPESTLAGKLGTKAYHCLVADAGLGVTYEKKWLSQAETSQRMLYPKVGGTWWQGLIAIVVLLLLNLPFLTIFSGILLGWTIVQIMALWLTLAYMAVYAVYAYHIWNSNWWWGGLLWPLVIFQELVLFTWSMYGYARRTITWKGRAVARQKASAK